MSPLQNSPVHIIVWNAAIALRTANFWVGKPCKRVGGNNLLNSKELESINAIVSVGLDCLLGSVKLGVTITGIWVPKSDS